MATPRCPCIKELNLLGQTIQLGFNSSNVMWLVVLVILEEGFLDFKLRFCVFGVQKIAIGTSYILCCILFIYFFFFLVNRKWVAYYLYLIEEIAFVNLHLWCGIEEYSAKEIVLVSSHNFLILPLHYYY